MAERVSYYLTEEACEKRIDALVKRIAHEHVTDGPYTFDPESDFWKLPKSLQLRVANELHP